MAAQRNSKADTIRESTGRKGGTYFGTFLDPPQLRQKWSAGQMEHTGRFIVVLRFTELFWSSAESKGNTSKSRPQQRVSEGFYYERDSILVLFFPQDNGGRNVVTVGCLALDEVRFRRLGF